MKGGRKKILTLGLLGQLKGIYYRYIFDSLFFLDTTSQLMTLRASLTPATIKSKWQVLFSKVPEFEKKNNIKVTSLPWLNFFETSCFEVNILFRVN